MSKKHSPRPEQLKIAGTERPDRIKELDKLAEEYRDVHDQVTALRDYKNELVGKLVTELQARGLERYVYEDRAGELREISIEELELKVKLRRVGGRPREEVDEGGSN